MFGWFPLSPLAPALSLSVRPPPAPLHKPPGNKVLAFFDVVSWGYGAYVTLEVTAPSGKQLQSFVSESEGRVDFTATEDGEFNFCFKNAYSETEVSFWINTETDVGLADVAKEGTLVGGAGAESPRGGGPGAVGAAAGGAPQRRWRVLDTGACPATSDGGGSVRGKGQWRRERRHRGRATVWAALRPGCGHARAGMWFCGAETPSSGGGSGREHLASAWP